VRSRRASGTSGRSLGVAVSATSVRKILGRLAWRRRRGATRLTPEQLAPILAEALDKYVKWVGGYDVFFDSIGELIDEELPAEESALKAWLQDWFLSEFTASP
jgi:hypothetical protein